VVAAGVGVAGGVYAFYPAIEDDSGWGNSWLEFSAPGFIG